MEGLGRGCVLGGGQPACLGSRKRDIFPKSVLLETESAITCFPQRRYIFHILGRVGSY